MFVPLFLFALVCAQSPAGQAQEIVLDDGAAPEQWIASGSDGVEVAVSEASGPNGPAIRVDFDFTRGSGFFVVRRPVALELPENWEFSFDLKGPAPSNNLEFKLIDETGDNVWWVNQRDYVFPEAWTALTLKKRKFKFAWGPAGASKPLTRVSAIEIALAAGKGGKGTLLLDGLSFRGLAPAGDRPPIRVSTSSCTDMNQPPAVLPDDGRIDWRSAVGDDEPSVELDLGSMREFGGLTLDWSPLYARAYAIDLGDEQGTWRTVYEVRENLVGVDHIPLPEAEAAKIRVRITAMPGGSVLLRTIRVREFEYSEGLNSFLPHVARESKRGWFPRSFLGEQNYWTVVGAPEEEDEALVSEDGAVELGKAGPTIEPILLIDDRVVTWADMASIVSLTEGGSPLPRVSLTHQDLVLEVEACDVPGSRVALRYTLRNNSTERNAGFIALAIRPLQVLPHTHELNMFGGVSPLRSITREKQALSADGRLIRFTEEPWSHGATPFVSSEIVESLELGIAPELDVTDDALGLASGAALFEFDLAPGTERTVGVIADLSARPPAAAGTEAIALADVERLRRESIERWAALLDGPRFMLPPGAQRYADTFRTQVASILINRDGAAIQPGSRSYDRTWIRDGALTSTALLYAGKHEAARGFIEWFAPFQYDDGKVPCCADERGPDPVPEHDSHGQFIYAIAEYDRFMRDDDFVGRMLPRVRGAFEYIQKLRASRMTDAYRLADGLERAKFGLVPESISHEGYSAKPMHSYWDNFWTVRGLEDAVYLAQRAGDAPLLEAAELEAESMRRCLHDSIALAASIKAVAYVPGCVELGDFDPTSTSIGVFPVEATELIPERLLEQTFARYIDWFDRRARGEMQWIDYTPYEIRNTTTYLFLNQRAVTHRMMDFFFADQRPKGWNAWAEVVRNGYRTAGFIGDLPHTWVGSDFVKLLRTIFVHETSEGGLILGMGIPDDWIDSPGGARAEGLPTHFGVVDVAFERREGARVVRLNGVWREPPEWIEIALENLRGARIEADGREVTIGTSGRLRINGPVREVVIR